MENKLTLLVDGNWLLMSRLFFISDKFGKNKPEAIKEAAKEELQDILARSISIMLSKHQIIDNLIIVADNGSWRKELPIPKQLEDITYKGNRETQQEIDWDCIYESFNEFLRHVATTGVTVSQGNGIEGDDWVWYWTRRLNEEGINTMIWTSDCDLKQLVQVHNQAFTAWYNDKSGLVLPIECQTPQDPLDFFLNPPFNNDVLITLTRPLSLSVNYINPDEIVMNKILCGDNSDNIKSVVRFRKNNKNYGFTQKDYEKLITEVKVDSMPEFLKNDDGVIEGILSNKKFKDHHFNPEDIREMLKYNTKLVWLNENIIPQTVITKMASAEYKVFNVKDIRLNYRILTPSKIDIESIFNGAF